MATYAQGRKFVDELFHPAILEDVIDWINNNLSPDDVFDLEELKDWAINNGFIEEE